MRHKAHNMDSIGATIGVLNIAKSNDKEGYIVFDQDDVLTGVSRVIEEIKEDGELWKHFISPTEAESIITEKSLIVVVDTHKPAMVAHTRSEEHTSELQSRGHLVCRLLLEKKNKNK